MVVVMLLHVLGLATSAINKVTGQKTALVQSQVLPVAQQVDLEVVPHEVEVPAKGVEDRHLHQQVVVESVSNVEKKVIGRVLVLMMAHQHSLLRGAVEEGELEAVVSSGEPLHQVEEGENDDEGYCSVRGIMLYTI